jgi:pimeloyl-ACP methyl ester carboxylesterase
MERLHRLAPHIMPSPAAATPWDRVLAKFPDGVAPKPPAGWEDGFLMSHGARLHYWRSPGGSRPDGSPRPVLLLSHGFGDNGLSWWYLFKDLTDQFELICVEARGHGLSDPPTAATPSDAQADDIAGAIAALGLLKPIVMGHSMGAASAMWFAAKYPDLPRAVVLEDPGMGVARSSGAMEPRPSPTAKETAAAWAAAQQKALSEDIFMKNNMSTHELLHNTR